MRKYKQIFILLSVLLVSYSCQTKNRPLNIIYEPLEVDDCQKDLRKGNVAICFTSGFDNEPLFLYKNDSLLEKLKLTTSCIIGLAGYIEVGSIEQVKTIGLKCINSELKLMECNTENQRLVVWKV